jgi:hypothetical protein
VSKIGHISKREQRLVHTAKVYRGLVNELLDEKYVSIDTATGHRVHQILNKIKELEAEATRLKTLITLITKNIC